MLIIKRDSKAWQQGFNTGLNCMFSWNPYDLGSERAFNYMNGFMEGRAAATKTTKKFIRNPVSRSDGFAQHS